MNVRTVASKIRRANRAGAAVFTVASKTIEVCGHLLHPSVPRGQKDVQVSFAGKKIKIRCRRTFADHFVVQQCFAQGQYDMPQGPQGTLIEKRYQEIVASGRKPLIVDCGANIGSSLLWFAARYPAAHIIAFEPSGENFALLQYNCAGLDAELIQAGVSGESGMASLVDPGLGTIGYQTIPGGTGPQVCMIALGPFLASQTAYVPFILKIDVEGAEKTLFDANTEIFNQFPLILMEPHDWLLPGQGSSLGFFRFHADWRREFASNNENIASIAYSAI